MPGRGFLHPVDLPAVHTVLGAPHRSMRPASQPLCGIVCLRHDLLDCTSPRQVAPARRRPGTCPISGARAPIPRDRPPSESGRQWTSSTGVGSPPQMLQIGTLEQRVRGRVARSSDLTCWGDGVQVRRRAREGMVGHRRGLVADVELVLSLCLWKADVYSTWLAGVMH